MRHQSVARPSRVCVLLGAALIAGASPARAQFPPDSFTNLRVLPRDIPQRELVDLMAGFTRALGVRCSHCHVGEENRSLATYDFASDEKPLKRKARTMLDMLQRINGEHLASLEERADPPVRVQCITCHRGARQPRMLQDVLSAAWEAGGADSVAAAYHALRERYYGRFTFDFSEVPLADVAGDVARRPGGLADADQLHALNVAMNPGSAFAKRQHAATALVRSFGESAAAGRARHAELRQAYGETVVSEPLINQTGYDLLGRGDPRAAVDAFRLNTQNHPESANAWDSLGEGLAALGEVAEAIRAYERSLALDPSNTNATEQLRRLRGRSRP